MPLSPDEFYARCLEYADAERRLPMPDQSMWEIFPFELEGLRVKPFEPPVLPEPPRSGEGDKPCGRCARGDSDAVWSDERWVLSGFEEPLGLRTVAATLSAWRGQAHSPPR